VRRLLRLNRRFDTWVSRQPLWRVAIAFYGLLVLATYVASWTSNRHPPPGDSASFHVIYPAIMTAGVLFGVRAGWRRRGLIAPRQRHADPGGNPQR
jgi:peptidoglycan/LPS O-acetylase OafA/YrhL